MCGVNFGQNFWMGIFILYSLLWSLFLCTSVVDQNTFSMNYWFECFALNALAMSASLFYYANPLPACQIIGMVALLIATTTNMLAFLHMVVALIRCRNVCTPEIQLGPLSFMRLTHSAMRQSLATVRFHLELINLNDTKSWANLPSTVIISRLFMKSTQDKRMRFCSKLLATVSLAILKDIKMSTRETSLNERVLRSGQ